MPRRSRPIDVQRFTSLVEESLIAFLADCSYAEAMARHAATIHSKREVWRLRLELRAVETAQAIEDASLEVAIEVA